MLRFTGHSNAVFALCFDQHHPGPGHHRGSCDGSTPALAPLAVSAERNCLAEVVEELNRGVAADHG
jgi:hypothetical protein